MLYITKRLSKNATVWAFTVGSSPYQKRWETWDQYWIYDHWTSFSWHQSSRWRLWAIFAECYNQETGWWALTWVMLSFTLASTQQAGDIFGSSGMGKHGNFAHCHLDCPCPHTFSQSSSAQFSNGHENEESGYQPTWMTFSLQQTARSRWLSTQEW